MEWLDESEKTLDSEVEIANDPDKIKTQLTQHKVRITLSRFTGKRMKVKTAAIGKDLKSIALLKLCSAMENCIIQ